MQLKLPDKATSVIAMERNDDYEVEQDLLQQIIRFATLVHCEVE